MKKGFTLIELLVVVLIIGILAAVALPQYEKAVKKSRFATLKPLVSSISQAEEIYYMTNGKYTMKTSELDLEFSDVKKVDDLTIAYTYNFLSGAYCQLFEEDQGAGIVCSNSITDQSIQLTHYFNHSDVYPGKTYCRAGNKDLTSVQNRFCKSDTGKASYSWYTNSAYYWEY